MNPKRHKDDTKTFEELTFQEQAKTMNMTALQFRKQLKAHLRRPQWKVAPRSESCVAVFACWNASLRTSRRLNDSTGTDRWLDD